MDRWIVNKWTVFLLSFCWYEREGKLIGHKEKGSADYERIVCDVEYSYTVLLSVLISCINTHSFLTLSSCIISPYTEAPTCHLPVFLTHAHTHHLFQHLFTVSHFSTSILSLSHSCTLTEREKEREVLYACGLGSGLISQGKYVRMRYGPGLWINTLCAHTNQTMAKHIYCVCRRMHLLKCVVCSACTSNRPSVSVILIEKMCGCVCVCMFVIVWVCVLYCTDS